MKNVILIFCLLSLFISKSLLLANETDTILQELKNLRKIEQEKQKEENLKTQRFFESPPSNNDIFIDDSDKNKDEENINEVIAQNYRSIFEHIDAHLGLFNYVDLKKNTFTLLHSSIVLKEDLFDSMGVYIGIYGGLPLHISPKGFYQKELSSKFITHIAYLEYKVEDFFSIKGGRLKATREWLKSYEQGVDIDINYEWINVFINYVNEIAYAQREGINDYKVLKTNFGKTDMLIAGVDLSAFNTTLRIYHYLLSKLFYSFGTRANADFKLSNFIFKTDFQYAYLRDRKQNRNTNIYLLNQNFTFKDNIYLYAIDIGFIYNLGGEFILGKLGNLDILEKNWVRNYLWIYNYSSNFFKENTLSFYGGFGIEMYDFALNFLGRNSTTKSSPKVIQNEYSLSTKYNIVEGLDIGLGFVFLQEQKNNLSYFKGFLEFAI